MKTQIIKINSDNIMSAVNEAADIIKNGGLVIFPTETVYGIGANALDEQASKKIYEAKGRPSDNPLIIHISNLKQLSNIVKEVDDKSKTLIKNYWPGPLTLILKKTDIVPYATTGGLDTVAVRMPSNKIAQLLIEQSNIPIAAPSANISGRPSITSEEFIVEEFNGKVDMILLDDFCDIGIESTVVDMSDSNNICILRPGFITRQDMQEILKEDISFDTNIQDLDISPKSPGMKYKHYSPNCDIYIVKGTIEEQCLKIAKFTEEDMKQNINSTVLCKAKYLHLFKKAISLGSSDIDVAKKIFAVLRKLDKEYYEKAYFLDMQDSELEFSIMDRVKKASANRFI